MSKDDVAALCKQLYDRACGVFGEKFDEEYQVKKRDMEIHNLEMETSIPRNLQDPQAEEGEQVQTCGRGGEVKNLFHLKSEETRRVKSFIFISSNVIKNLNMKRIQCLLFVISI